jgi:hypothetical protein
MAHQVSIRTAWAVTAVMLLAIAWAAPAAAQIRVHPTGVNVSARGATTVFLTFGGLTGQTPAEAMWCGSLIPAAPDIGLKCDPATIYGALPARFDRSRASGTGGFTDIMSIPASVSRRAYQAAEAGARPSFFYVRRFANPFGPDEYVAVTCRLAGGGARVPFSLVDVRVAFASDTPILYVRQHETPPSLRAEIAYTGTGRLKGRWEVVHPGEEPPSAQDLLTEATLPLEQRGLQRRYTEVGRFNVFLPPTGRVTLPGPDPGRLPVAADGGYLVLLRIEASDDKEADSSLASAGAGPGLVHGGAVAGFPMPPLRYIVGAASTEGVTGPPSAGLTLVAPGPDATIAAEGPLEFRWMAWPGTVVYRVEIQASDGTTVLSALVDGVAPHYRTPPWLRDRAPDGRLLWRVVAIGASGDALRFSAWRTLTIEP